MMQLSIYTIIHRKIMEQLKQTFQETLRSFDWQPLVESALRIVIILVFSWLVVRLAKGALRHLENHLLRQGRKAGENSGESQKRVDTLINLLRQATVIAVSILALLMILQQIGVKVGPVIASAGILGLAVGFGAQNLVKDVISGFFIILENQIRVGDVAVLNGTGGLVERIKFRTTVLRDLGGVVHVFPNGSIDSISNLTLGWSAYVFDIGVAYKEDTDRVIGVMREVGRKLKEDEEFGEMMLEEPEIFGVDKFDDSAVVIKGRIRTKPIKQWDVGRQYMRRIKQAFDERNIEIPFPHTSLYFGEASKPLAVRTVEFDSNENPEEK
ncbi:mechanosensitive ion channel family protein [Kiritimatiellaeota bacterium B1221]|nr:mechanosensitive ion channel family protein [Kiritimatiellaeota bacterium B1221]